MPRTKKPKVHPDQEELPGAEGNEKLPHVITAAKRYIRERNARIKANAEEKAAHDHLMEVMTNEGLTDYEYGGISVHIDSSYKVKVTGPEKVAESNGEPTED